MDVPESHARGRQWQSKRKRSHACPTDRIADSRHRKPIFTTLVNEAGDDRDDIQPGDQVLLIVENDEAFARFLLEAARNKGMKGLVTSLGATALALVRQYQPHAVTLDLHLPDIDGWRVMERLKCDVALAAHPRSA